MAEPVAADNMTGGLAAGFRWLHTAADAVT
jgi:hypothetical protein